MPRQAGSRSSCQTLGTMKTTLRIISFATGSALAVAPMLLLLWFSYSVGEPPTSHSKGFNYFASPLLVGLIFGGGLLLVGFPSLVAGKKRPITRIVAAIFLVVSSVAVVRVGFGSLVATVAGLMVFLVDAIAFYYFVYPAKRFLGDSSMVTTDEA